MQTNRFSNIIRRLPVAILIAGVPLTASALGSSYSTGFEDFSLGQLSPDMNSAQGGWSGGAQGGLTNNNPGDEAITNADSHGGSQSWRLSRGYNSPGQGTAFSPNITPLSLEGDVFTGSIWFKAVTAGDNSSVAIETGTPDGTDRANIVAYITNGAGGLSLTSYTGANFDNVGIATGVSATTWHNLSFTITKSGFTDATSLSSTEAPRLISTAA